MQQCNLSRSNQEQIFPRLPVDQALPARVLRVALIAPGIAGTRARASICAQYERLSESLSAAGHNVHLFDFGMLTATDEESRASEEAFSRSAVQYVRITAPGQQRFLATLEMSRSWQAYQILKEYEFDIIHCPEWTGLAYYSLLAKRQNLAFSGTHWRIGLDGPSEWRRLNNRSYSDKIEHFIVDYMEKCSVEWADTVTSSHRYLLEWAQENGWCLPKNTFVQPNIVSARYLSGQSVLEQQAIEEIVFLTNPESFFWVKLCCDAIDLLSDQMSSSCKVTFLNRVAGEDIEETIRYLKCRATRWTRDFQYVTGLDKDEAHSYLSQHGRLAVIVSPEECLSGLVEECMVAGIPFIAHRFGALAERLVPHDFNRLTFLPYPESLRECLHSALMQGYLPLARSSQDCDLEKNWLTWHQSIPLPRAVERVSSEPFVSVCIAHRNRPGMLAQALESLNLQTYSNFEVVIIDDGSDMPEAIAYLDQLEKDIAHRNWRVIRQQNSFIGAARNRAAREARGQYLLFMDDDNYAKPHEIETFVSVSQINGADILTCPLDIFDGGDPPDGGGMPTSTRLFLGAAPLVGVIMNVFGDANCFVNKEAFLRIGGFTEDVRVGHDDWEFFAHAVLSGLRLEVIPEPLVWYRQGHVSLTGTTVLFANQMRGLRPYEKILPESLAKLPRLALGLYLRAGCGMEVTDLQERLFLAKRANEDCLDSVNAAIDGIWHSRSWQLFAPIRNLCRLASRLEPEKKPVSKTMAEALKNLAELESTLSWSLTGPLRALLTVSKLLGRR